MIFASVGSMLPFERLVRTVDQWAADHPSCDVFLQIGETRYEPRHAAFARMLPMTEYRSRLRACELFVAHVGMGSILQALEERKQALLLVRDHARGEHTTDHQAHTAKRFGHLPGLRMVSSSQELHGQMSALSKVPLTVGDAISGEASAELVGKVRGFLAGLRA